MQASANYYRYINDDYDFGGGSMVLAVLISICRGNCVSVSVAESSSPQVNYKETGVSWYFYYALSHSS